MTSAPHGGRVAVEPRAAGTVYVTPAGLSETPHAAEKPSRRGGSASVTEASTVPAPATADTAAKPQE